MAGSRIGGSGEEDVKMIEVGRSKCLEKTGRDKSERRIACCLLRAQLVALLIRLVWLASSSGRAAGLVQVPNRHTVASIPGDLVIGILVPVHERPSPKQAQTRTCGAVREQYGIQRVEAAFRTIDSINADPSILPNITLGIEIRDSCWHSPIALEQSIEFIRDAMAASELGQVPKPAPAAAAAAASGSFGTPPAAESSPNASALCAPLLLRQQQQQQVQAKKVKNIVGVVGPASSTDTVQVQNLLQLFNMPQVGYSATSRDLSNKNFFKYFLRVVPSDKLQAQVMIDLMLAHNWTYITVAYTEGSYGSSLMNAFRERAQEVGICFATLESMPPNADDAKFDELIDAIQKHPNARVVICMCEGRTLGKLFSGFKRKNIINQYLVVGSDGWSDRFDVVEKQEEYALGGISIRIHSAYVNDFDHYYFALNPFTNHRNPWFAEFWETRFQCNLELGSGNSMLSNANQAKIRANQQLANSRPFVRPPGAKIYNRSCTGRESLRNNHKQDAKMAFVQKSIITMALGLDSMQRAICQSNKSGLCPEMLPVNGSILLQHLMNVSFSFLDENVHFDEQGDPPGKYEILNFQRRRPSLGPPLAPDDAEPRPPASDELAGAFDEAELRRNSNPLYDSYSTLRVFRALGRARRAAGENPTAPPQHNPPASGYSSSSGYEYVHVGSWKSSDGLSLFGDIHWPAWNNFEQEPGGFASAAAAGGGVAVARGARNGLPESVCAQPCARGHAKKIQSDSVKCCWVCVLCRPNEYLFNEFKCKACEKGWWPNGIRTGCEQIPIQYLYWRSLEALTAISIASFGLLLTLATAIVFIKHNNTPVVKSTTRELSYMILFAMFLCYLNTFLLVAKPHKLTCLITRILPGFAFAMMYGALVTKTNRIARILAGSKKKIITRRLRFMSATSQVAITWIIVLIECAIIVFMLIQEPPDKMFEYPSDERVVLVCNTTTMGIIAPLGFDFFLIAMCTLYAFKTRNVPENFNEAKFIGFTMYTTLVIWIAFVVIYLSSEHKVTTLCLCISFSALFALLLLFFPRCYIIIFEPEKNNRSYFTTTKNVRCHIGYQIGSAGAAAALALQNASTLNGSSSLSNGANWCTNAANLSLDCDHYDPISALNQKAAFARHRVGPTEASEWAGQARDLWPAAGSGLRRPSEAEAAPSPFGRSPNSSLGASLLHFFTAVFARRLRRKEIDKVSSIQQHLRAIRLAENLDRQTHFRRSQVQRLVQRFDSLEPNRMSWPNRNGKQVQDVASAAPNSNQQVAPLSSQDADRLLSALGQLIGPQALWRLAEALKRHCCLASLNSTSSEPLKTTTRPTTTATTTTSAQSGSPIGKTCNSNDNGAQQRQLALLLANKDGRLPLDLEKLTDRRFGLMLLRFLNENLRKSMDEMSRLAPLRSLSADSLGKQMNESFDLHALQESGRHINSNNMQQWSAASATPDTNVVCKSTTLLSGASRPEDDARLLSSGNELQLLADAAQLRPDLSLDLDLDVDLDVDLSADLDADPREERSKNKADNKSLSPPTSNQARSANIKRNLLEPLKLGPPNPQADPIERALQSIMGVPLPPPPLASKCLPAPNRRPLEAGKAALCRCKMAAIAIASETVSLARDELAATHQATCTCQRAGNQRPRHQSISSTRRLSLEHSSHSKVSAPARISSQQSPETALTLLAPELINPDHVEAAVEGSTCANSIPVSSRHVQCSKGRSSRRKEHESCCKRLDCCAGAACRRSRHRRCSGKSDRRSSDRQTNCGSQVVGCSDCQRSNLKNCNSNSKSSVDEKL